MAAEAVFRVVGFVFLVCTCTALFSAGVAVGNWCVARSDAGDQALQTAIDYACGAGADCAPIQQNGLCFLPNTPQAHASYAFNSYYQRKNNAPDSCSFAGTSTVARTDPSYGSCVYPSTPGSAGGLGSSGGTTTSTTTPSAAITPPLPPSGITPLYGGGTGLLPGTGPVIPDAPLPSSSKNLMKTVSSPITFVLSFLIVFQRM